MYDKGVVKIGDTKHFGRVADVLKKGKKGNVSKLTQISGLGLKLGKRMHMSGGACQSCHGSEMNDKFILENVAL